MKKTFLIISFVLLVCLLLAACTPEDSGTDESYKIPELESGKDSSEEKNTNEKNPTDGVPDYADSSDDLVETIPDGTPVDPTYADDSSESLEDPGTTDFEDEDSEEDIDDEFTVIVTGGVGIG